MPVQQTLTQTFTLIVEAPLTITTTALAVAVQGKPYSFQMTAAGGNSPYTWTATGLPAGLSISAGGLISGTPTVNGSFSAVITVSDTAQ